MCGFFRLGDFLALCGLPLLGGLSSLSVVGGFPPLLLLPVLSIPLPLSIYLRLDFLSGRSLSLLRALVLRGLIWELRHFVTFYCKNINCRKNTLFRTLIYTNELEVGCSRVRVGVGCELHLSDAERWWVVMMCGG